METKISQDLKDALLTDLNEAQIEAVTHLAGPLLIVAGAGTGKTTVITRRICWLVLLKNINLSEVLALTFTEKAAHELEERVDRLLPYGYVELWVSTFHSFAERILRAHALDIGLSPNFRLLDTTGAWLLVRKNLNRFSLKHYRPLGNPTKFIHALISHFGRAKDELVAPQDYLEYIENIKLNNDSCFRIGGKQVDKDLFGDEILRIDELANGYHVYEQILIENNALDFGSLIMRTVQLLKTRPAVLKKYRDQFKYILVDEFQDTNIAQYELVKLLASPQNNLTVVGDDDQSIYKFRGASISNIMEFKKDFRNAREIFLTKNYRSRQNILDLAYNFIKQNNPNRLEYQLGDKLSKRLVSTKDELANIEHLHAETSHGEANIVLKKILDLKKQNQDLTWNDFAVLIRANDHAKLFIRTFDAARIPFELIGAKGLYNRPIVLDLIAFLKLLVDFLDNPSFYRVITSPISKFTSADVVELVYWANRKNWSIYHTLKNSATLGFEEKTISECVRILGLLEKFASQVKQFSVSHLIYSIVEETGYLSLLTQDDNDENRKSLKDLNQFYKKALKWDSETENVGLKEFLNELEFEIESGEEGKIEFNPEEGPESVKILTCHAAKGLEFSHVFVTNLVDRRFPTTERKEPIELPDDLVKESLLEGDMHLEEERRLFYVACTRAKDGLFLTSAEEYGGSRKKKLSRFLEELASLKLIKLATEKNEARKIELFNQKISDNEVRPSIQLSSKKSDNHYFSFSQLKAFDTCPLQYKFAHVLRIPVRGRPTFSFGKTIHKTLQKFCEAVKIKEANAQGSLFPAREVKPENSFLVTLDELFKIYDESWIDDWYLNALQKKEYYEKGKDVLRAFYEESFKIPPKPIYLEQSFNIKIGDYTIKGVIDRIDKLPDGTLEIIDYKTGRSREENKIEKDQLYIYQIAIAESFREIPSKLTYYFVEDGKRVSFIGTSEDLIRVKADIVEQINEIQQSAFPATPAKEKCSNCDFRNICEFKIL